MLLSTARKSKERIEPHRPPCFRQRPPRHGKPGLLAFLISSRLLTSRSLLQPLPLKFPSPLSLYCLSIWISSESLRAREGMWVGGWGAESKDEASPPRGWQGSCITPSDHSHSSGISARASPSSACRPSDHGRYRLPFLLKG